MSAAAPARPSTSKPSPEPKQARRKWSEPLRKAYDRFYAWRNAKIASSSFQSWAARFWATRALARADAARLYDLTAGFVYSQTLYACIELDVLETLRARPRTAASLAREIGLAPERAALLLQAATAIGLAAPAGDERFRLGRLGAAALGAPGLIPMIRHHRLFYADLADPVSLLKGAEDTELARFWPYVRGGDAVSKEAAAEYSALMAASQTMVAEETLAAVSLAGRKRLMDVGGGVGAFLTAAARRWPQLEIALFDLPDVAAEGARRFRSEGLDERATVHSGAFLEHPLPEGADAISLVRVLYDHDDETVRRLLRRVRSALAPGGLLIVSEPMSGGARPQRAGDAYFGFYTLAMTSGRPRSAARHAALLREAGFVDARPRRTARAFITGVVTAHRPE